MKTLAGIAAFLGALIAATASAGCMIAFVDEPTMPKSLL